MQMQMSITPKHGGTGGRAGSVESHAREDERESMFPRVQDTSMTCQKLQHDVKQCSHDHEAKHTTPYLLLHLTSISDISRNSLLSLF